MSECLCVCMRVRLRQGCQAFEAFGKRGVWMNRKSTGQVCSSDTGRAARYGTDAGEDDAGDGVGIL